MNINEFQMNKKIIARNRDGNEIKGILKGINENVDGEVIVTIEHLYPCLSKFNINEVYCESEE